MIKIQNNKFISLNFFVYIFSAFLFAYSPFLLATDENDSNNNDPKILEREIGAGAFGIINLYRDPRTNEIWVVKELIPNLDDASLQIAREAIQREICFFTSVGTDTHINILLPYRRQHAGPDLFENHQIPLPYCSNGDLSQWLLSRNLSEAELLRIFHQITSALLFLKKHKFIHFDLKPENFLIDSTGTIKLSDFGLAEPWYGSSGSVQRGTPAYSAPQAINGDDFRFVQADLYSLGKILEFLLEKNHGRSSALFKTIANDLRSRLLNAQAEKNIRDITFVISHPLTWMGETGLQIDEQMSTQQRQTLLSSTYGYWNQFNQIVQASYAHLPSASVFALIFGYLYIAPARNEGATESISSITK